MVIRGYKDYIPQLSFLAVFLWNILQCIQLCFVHRLRMHQLWTHMLYPWIYLDFVPHSLKSSALHYAIPKAAKRKKKRNLTDKPIWRECKKLRCKSHNMMQNNIYEAWGIWLWFMENTVSTNGWSDTKGSFSISFKGFFLGMGGRPASRCQLIKILDAHTTIRSKK